MDFSSPLVVKVRREVARERREEVDLETGNRRSWIESVEYDMLDLTGRTLLHYFFIDLGCFL